MAVTFLTNEDKAVLDGQITALSEEIANIHEGERALTVEDIIQGSVDQIGTVISREDRIRTRGYIKVREGDRAHFVPGTSAGEIMISVFDSKKTFVSDNGWYDTETDYCFTDNGYAIFIFRNISGAEITPDEYDATLNIQAGTSFASINESMSASNFAWLLTDNKKCFVDVPEWGDYTLRIETGCWVVFYSNQTGEKFTTLKELKSQLGDACTLDDESATVTISMRDALVFDLDNLSYKLTPCAELRRNHAIIFAGYGGKGVTGAAVELAGVFERNKIRKELSTSTDVVMSEVNIAACKRFAALFKDTSGLAESFVFFTDPHLANGTDLFSYFGETMDSIKSVYDATPTSMCVCGGDWLTNSNTAENACWLLGRIDGAMRSRFDKWVNIVGNHDSNYQGDTFQSSGNYDGCILSEEAVRNLWYREYGNAYFAVDGGCTRFYVFNTGLDWDKTMDAYRWEQVDWFANALIDDKPERCAALMHITTSDYVATPFVTAITQIANAYNAKSSVTLNGKTYNFANATGRFYFVIGGHAHVDMDIVENGIPVVLTTNLWSDANTPSWDLVLADYDANKLRLVRCGVGDDREFTMA